MAVPSNVAKVGKVLLPEAVQPVALKWFYRLRGIKYWGDDYYCPVCESSFRKFAPNGRGKPNSSCPGCGSRERHRLRWLFIKNETELLNPSEGQKRVFHVAPELSTVERLKEYPHIEHVSVDLKSPVADLQVDITDIPDDVGGFNAVICSHVLEHIDDDRSAMKELFRVLKPGGWAIINVPVDYDLEETQEDLSINDPEERKRRYGHPDHRRRCGADYPEQLEAVGFDVTVYDYLDEVSEKDNRDFLLPVDDPYGANRVHFCKKSS